MVGDLDPLEDLDSTMTVRFTQPGDGRFDLHRRAPVLLVMVGQDFGTRIPLTKCSVTIGRTEEADVVVSDQGISRRHAAIHCDLEKGHYRIEDLQSTNGTRVNGAPVRESPLRDGDKIFLGATVLKFALLDEIDIRHGQVVDEMAFRDELTGLVAKRRFYEELRAAFEKSKRQRRPLGMLMMDLDGLKQINDTHGHSTGAGIIARSGRLIGEVVNPIGQSCRFGGDEFVAFLPDCDLGGVLAVGERVRLAIAENKFEKDGTRLKVSISIGAAAAAGDLASIDALNEYADTALYRAKAKGRNCVSD